MTKEKRQALVKFVILAAGVLAGLILFLTPTVLTNAQDNNVCTDSAFSDVAGGCAGIVKNATGTTGPAKVADTILRVARILVFIAAAVSVIFIIIGGYKWMNESGGYRGGGEGKETVQNAIIGLAVCLAALLIIQIIVGFIEGAKKDLAINSTNNTATNTNCTATNPC